MRKIIHWIISIIAAAFIGVVAIAALAGIGYALYLMVTEATIVIVFAGIMGVVYWAGSYLEKHGFAWNPTDPSDCE